VSYPPVRFHYDPLIPVILPLMSVEFGQRAAPRGLVLFGTGVISLTHGADASVLAVGDCQLLPASRVRVCLLLSGSAGVPQFHWPFSFWARLASQD